MPSGSQKKAIKAGYAKQKAGKGAPSAAKSRKAKIIDKLRNIGEKAPF